MKRKVIYGLYGFLLVTFVFSAPVHAYIDPATTTYVIQIITALVITLGVTIGVFFTRMKLSILQLYVRVSGFFIKLFSKKRGQGKSPQKQRTTYQAKQYTAQERRSLWADDRPFRQRLMMALCVSGAFAFTFVLFGTYELYMLNIDSFNFPFKLLIVPFILLAVIVFFIMLGIIMFLKGRVFDATVTFIFGVVLAGYIQGNFLNKDLGTLTGDTIDWSARGGQFVLNAFIWIAILSIPFIIKAFKKKVWSAGVKAVSCLLIVIQLISMIVLHVSTDIPHKQEDEYLSTKGIYDVSKGKNIIVIVLDRLDNRYLERVKEQDPQFFDRLDGFTQFTNNMSTYSQTFPSVANMFSGKLHMFERSRRDYLKDVWLNAPFLPGLRNHQFGVNLYMEAGYTYDKASDLKGVADNVVESKIQVHKMSSVSQFMRLSAFRYSPLGAKPFYWTSTDQFSQLVLTDSNTAPYVTNDLYFYDQLRKQKLSINSRENQFTYIHLQGPHAPYVMNEKAEPVPAEKSGSTIQTKGSFHIVFEYLDQLKRLGLYEQSTIVITGDHGSRRDDTKPLESAIVTGLFVKPAGQAGTPLAYNHSPVSQDNLRPFVYQQAGLPYKELGQTYFEVPMDGELVRYLYHRLMKTDENPSRLLIYEIKGNANVFENWQLIEDRVVEYR